MPNWAFNEIKISSSKDDIKRIQAQVFNADRDFDFNRIIPEDRCNPNYQVTGVRIAEDGRRVCNESLCLDGQVDNFNWYAWRYDHWNTKWNACETYCMQNEDGTYLEISFNTAWAAPIPIFRELCRFYPEAEIDIHCSEESNEFLIDGRNENGEFVYTNRNPDDVIFTPENKRDALIKAIEYENLDPSDYDIDRMVADDEFYFDVDSDDRENDYAHPLLIVYDLMDSLEKYRR